MKNLNTLFLTFTLALSAKAYGCFWEKLFGKEEKEYELACNAHTDNPDISCLQKRFEKIGKEVLAQPSVQKALRDSFHPESPQISFVHAGGTFGFDFFAGACDTDVVDALSGKAAGQPKFFVAQSDFHNYVKFFRLSQYDADAITRLTLLHEIGHVAHKDCYKKLILKKKADQGFIESPGIQNFLKHQPEFNRLLQYIHDVERDFKKDDAAEFVSEAREVFSRTIERKADTFAIKHATSPFDLMVHGKYFELHHKHYPHNGSGTYPSSAKRAQAFLDAAQRLMVKQRLEGGKSLGRKA